MLRGFQLVSDPVAYSATGEAIINFPNKTGPNRRAAIIGIEVVAANPINSYFNLITRFDIVGRNYFQGDPFPVGLVAGGARPDQAAGVVPFAGRSYFPGQRIVLADGTRCSGMKLEGRDEIRLTLQRVGGAGNNILFVVLHGLEYPKTDRVPKQAQLQIDREWDKFSAGEGQFHMHGATATQAAGLPFQESLDSKINAPYSVNCRRREVRGVTLDEVGFAVMESEFVNTTVSIGAQEQTPHSSQGIPSRAVVGHAHLSYVDQVAVDIERKASSIILFMAPAPAGARKTRFVATFEGVSVDAVPLCGPAVFS